MLPKPPLSNDWDASAMPDPLNAPTVERSAAVEVPFLDLRTDNQPPLLEHGCSLVYPLFLKPTPNPTPRAMASTTTMTIPPIIHGHFHLSLRPWSSCVRP